MSRSAIQPSKPNVTPESQDPASEGYSIDGALAQTVRDQRDRIHAEAERVREDRLSRQEEKGGALRVVGIAVAAAVLAFEAVMTLGYFRDQRQIAKPPAAPAMSETLVEANACRDVMLGLAKALQDYAAKNGGEYPATLDGLVATGLIEKVPQDPKTGTAFQYESGSKYFSLAAPNPAAYGVEDIRTTKDGVPVIALAKR